MNPTDLDRRGHNPNDPSICLSDPIVVDSIIAKAKPIQSKDSITEPEIDVAKMFETLSQHQLTKWLRSFDWKVDEKAIGELIVIESLRQSELSRAVPLVETLCEQAIERGSGPVVEKLGPLLSQTTLLRMKQIADKQFGGRGAICEFLAKGVGADMPVMHPMERERV